MKIIFIFGPQSVGKMSVGQELEKLIGLKLFHGHMTSDIISPFFPYPNSDEGRRLVNLYRWEFFKSVSKSSLEGIIYTFVWMFETNKDADFAKKIKIDLPREDRKFINKVYKLFKRRSADVYFVELEADLSRRLERNKTPNRLFHKPPKRDIIVSENRLLGTERNYRVNSIEGEVGYKNYIRINNTNLQPCEVAHIIANSISG